MAIIFLAAGNRNEYNHRSWHIGYILHGQDKGANSTKLTWERILNIWKTFKTFIELRIMQLSSHRICVWNYHDFIIFNLYFCSIPVFFFICHLLSIHLSTYKWLSCLCWSWRKVTFVGKGSLMWRVLMRMPSIVFKKTMTSSLASSINIAVYSYSGFISLVIE